jgi:MFS family permease
MSSPALIIENKPKVRAESSSSWRVLLAILLGHVFDGLDASIYLIVLFPCLSELLHSTSYTNVGVHGSIIMAIFMIGWASGAVIGGTVSDHFGRKRVVMVTILLYAVGSGLCAISHNWLELAFFRFLVGVGIGGEVSAGGVMLAESWSTRSRLHTSCLLPGAFAVGYLLAALLNLFLATLGWRWLFIAGVLPALLTVYIRLKLDDPLVFQLNQAYKRRLRAKKKSELTAEEAEVLRFSFFRIFSEQLRYKTLIVVAFLVVMTIGYWAALAWVPAWINQLTGTSAVQERSSAAVVMNVGSIIASALAGVLVICLGRRNAFRLAFLGSLIGCGGMFLTVKAFGPTLLTWVFASGFFCILPFALMYIYVPELFSTEVRATAFGFGFQIARMATAFAAIFSGQLIAFFAGSYALAGACIAGIYALGFLVTFFMPSTSGEVSDPTGVLQAARDNMEKAAK